MFLFYLLHVFHLSLEFAILKLLLLFQFVQWKLFDGTASLKENALFKQQLHSACPDKALPLLMMCRRVIVCVSSSDVAAAISSHASDSRFPLSPPPPPRSAKRSVPAARAATAEGYTAYNISFGFLGVIDKATGALLLLLMSAFILKL